MSTVTTPPATGGTAPSRGPVAELVLGGGRARRIAWLVVSGLVVLSAVRVISG
jgi:simple sugar transport system permease protein